MRRLTFYRKETLIKTTRDMNIEERKPYLDEWEMNEEEFQLMKRRYDQHGFKANQSSRIKAE